MSSPRARPHGVRPVDPVRAVLLGAAEMQDTTDTAQPAVAMTLVSPTPDGTGRRISVVVDLEVVRELHRQLPEVIREAQSEFDVAHRRVSGQ